MCLVQSGAGVATAFAARDVLGNMLSGLSMQFSKPFSLGDTIKVCSCMLTSILVDMIKHNMDAYHHFMSQDQLIYDGEQINYS